jgi:hypothetical protein
MTNRRSVNLLRVDRLVSTGGQPTMDDLARLKAERVKAVINQLGSLPTYGLRFWSATSTPASA